MNSNERRWDLDALRGLMLVLMAATHFPTVFSIPLGQPFGFVSAAEGFVMLSAYMAGMVYSARARSQGEDAMRDAFFKRAIKIYACQAALLAFAFTVVALLGMASRQDAVGNLLGFYFDQPVKALFSALLLIYNPALLDILPLYIVFMLISPVLLLHGMHHGWRGLLMGSVLLWLAAQFDLGLLLYGLADRFVTLPVTYPEMGAFEIFGWQFLWVLGLWMGATSHAQAADRATATAFPRWMVASAAAIAAVGVVWRHAVGQTPFPEAPGLALLLDKWHLGPLRLINFMALLVLVMHFAPALKKRLPRVAALEMLGQQSLPVFCAHLVVALVALALAGEATAQRPRVVDLSIFVGGFAVLFVVAYASRVLDERAAALLHRRRARRLGRVSGPPGAERSVPSTVHSPRR